MMNMSPKGLDLNYEKVKLKTQGRKVPAIILKPLDPKPDAPGILWIHGGGHIIGSKEMVYGSRAVDFVVKYGAVVVAPGYRLAWLHPYPKDIEDCYNSLLWMRDHAEELGFNPSQLFVGGESAGGGLTAATCLMARDKGEVSVAYQMPLYPMLDNLDTDSSRDNHNKVWNTKFNHLAWRVYLRRKAKSADASPYAAAARAEDLSGLPPAYTFICTDEPFYDETIEYFERLKAAGVDAEYDVFDGLYHSFDLFEEDLPETQQAIESLNQHFEWAMENCYADQPERA